MTEISSDVIRGYNDTIILYLLLKEPSYGYEISKKIRNLSEDKYVIKETTLYSAVTSYPFTETRPAEREEPITGSRKRAERIIMKSARNGY